MIKIVNEGLSKKLGQNTRPNLEPLFDQELHGLTDPGGCACCMCSPSVQGGGDYTNTVWAKNPH